jgi:hypothetical protein
VGRITTSARSGKRQARSPTYHFERLLEEACPHKLRDYHMIKNFMISGSLSQGMELKEILYGSDTMPFLREDTVMTVYDEHPHQEGVMCLT